MASWLQRPSAISNCLHMFCPATSWVWCVFSYMRNVCLIVCKVVLLLAGSRTFPRLDLVEASCQRKQLRRWPGHQDLACLAAQQALPCLMQIRVELDTINRPAITSQALEAQNVSVCCDCHGRESAVYEVYQDNIQL